ncbi:hypothetical protein Hypma_014925 [Hypsizygus marmoreus]|uniref:SMODS and SLOG-associating 2TM effector domain-containing protein n=1 Tax=Hypsizygus marmoreus TaxID=39966 RepID=A0A369KCB3_HYPMA|nr:hypothetical protein Hypma_014925 [Hypsizygus marmoreus]
MDNRERDTTQLAQQQHQSAAADHTNPSPPSSNLAASHLQHVEPLPRSAEKLDEETLRVPNVRRDGSRGRRLGTPLPPLPQARIPLGSGTIDTQHSGRLQSEIDWIVPVEDKPAPRRTVGERLQPTLDVAQTELDKCAMKARMTSYALNVAIGLQVLLGSLTTGLSAVTTGRQTAIVTTVLGGLATITASYLARARGSNEPELSITRAKDLEKFIRECQVFLMDHGHVYTAEHDDELFAFRDKFEEVMGNAIGERKLSPPV